MSDRQYFLASTTINKAEFDSLTLACDGLMHCINVEENFECLIENYRELEEFIFGEALDHAMARTKAYDDPKFPARTIGRKLANFLSSVRLYCSTIETHASAIVGNQSGAMQMDAAMARQFDSSQNYRVMDGLRNYAQHSALPVHSYMLVAKWTPDEVFLNYQFDPIICARSLRPIKNLERKQRRK
jgi:hypothetical protein